MERQRERVDRARDEVRPCLRRGQGSGEPGAGRALAVQPDRKAARLGDPGDQALDQVWRERARRVVDDHPRGPEVGQLPRLLDERLGLAAAARAVDEPRVERLPGARDRLARLAEVRDVVQRIVEPEDVDAVLGGTRDKAANDVAAHRSRADEEATAEGDSERRRRPRLERADALPRRLDATANSSVEDAAPRDLEARESRAVEDLGEPQQLRGRQTAGERLLREQAHGRVDELRHRFGTLASGQAADRGTCERPGVWRDRHEACSFACHTGMEIVVRLAAGGGLGVPQPRGAIRGKSRTTWCRNRYAREM